MRDCPNVDMRDLLPELLHDRLSPAEQAPVRAHVAQCAACAAELALLRDASAALVGAAPRVNADAVAATVHAALAAPRRAEGGAAVLAPRWVATPPAARPRRASRAALRAVAAVVVMALGAGAVIVARNEPPARPTQIAAHAPAAVATGTESAVAGPRVAQRAPVQVQVAEATPSRDARAAAATKPSPALGASFSDLSDAELADVIRAVDEYDEALPPLDPASTTPAPIEEGGL